VSIDSLCILSTSFTVRTHAFALYHLSILLSLCGEQVPLEGEQVMWQDPGTSMPQAAAEELKWAWQALQKCTRSQSMVVFYK